MTSSLSLEDLVGSLADWRTVADPDGSCVHHGVCYSCLDFLERLACLQVAGGQMELAKSFCQKFRRNTIAVTVRTNMAPIEKA